MSDTLGPIHYLMYEKIKYQDRLTAALLGANKRVRKELDAQMPPAAEEDLGLLLDTENIHGWLSAAIDRVEARFAHALRLVSSDAAGQILREVGREAARRALSIEKAAGTGHSRFGDAGRLFQMMNPFLLDGMPCDHALEAVEDGVGGLFLRQMAPVHRRYELEALEDINPEDSLSKTCDGGHDHESHESFELRQAKSSAADDALPDAATMSEGTRQNNMEGAPLFYAARLAWLQGFTADSDFGVERLSGGDFHLYKRETPGAEESGPRTSDEAREAASALPKKKMKRFVVATHNEGKLTEIKAVLAGLPLEVLGLGDLGVDQEVEETGDSFEANAALKVRAAAALFPDDYVMADDSGLCVDCLGGRPGIYSARYLGEQTPYAEKMAVLQNEIDSVDPEDRGAEFVCAICCRRPDASEFTVRGVIRGEIARNARGENGFGYDPIFLLPDLGKTSAELAPDVKNTLSHRGQALRKMLAVLRDDFL